MSPQAKGYIRKTVNEMQCQGSEAIHSKTFRLLDKVLAIRDAKESDPLNRLMAAEDVQDALMHLPGEWHWGRVWIGEAINEWKEAV